MARPEELTSAIILIDQSGNIVLKYRLEQSDMADHSESKNCSDLSKTKFYEDLKNVIVKLRDECDHFSIENKILKLDMGVRNSRSIFPHFAPACLAVSTFSVEDNCIFLAVEEDEHVKDEWASKKKQFIDDKVLIADKVLNPTKETQESFKKSRLPIPLKSYMNSRSQNITKIRMDEPDKVNEKQKMLLEQKNEVHNVTSIVNESLSAEKVYLNGCGIQNHADGTPFYLSREGSELCVYNNVDTSSNKHKQMVDYNVQTSPTISQDRSSVQLQLNRYQNSYSQLLTSPEQQDFKYAPENFIQYERALQNEKEESVTCLNQVTDLQKQMGALAPSRFAFLVETQAHELSFHRQQILDARNMCIVYHDHLINLIKAFEELLQASDVDYYVAEGFREQLNQSMHLLQTLEGKLCYELVIEKLQEIQTLRNLSEDSMTTNDKWQTLENDPEQEKQNENVILREFLSKKSYVCDHLHNEYERVHKENEKLCKKLDERDEEIKRLTHELSNTGNEFNTLQHKPKVKQCLLSDDNQVPQSLKSELEVCEKMSKVNKTEIDLMDNGHSSSQHSSSSLVISSTAVPRVVPGFQMWADKNGCHVLGLNEDHYLLHKHISEVWKLLSKTKSILEDFGSKQHRHSGSKMPDQGSLQSVGTNVTRAQKTLEEAACLSKLFWRVTLPRTVTDDFTNIDEMKMEISRLHNTLSRHQKRLHSTVKQLQSTNLIKENMEKIIIDKLALTHDILKKARGNLESTK